MYDYVEERKNGELSLRAYNLTIGLVLFELIFNPAKKPNTPINKEIIITTIMGICSKCIDV